MHAASPFLLTACVGFWGCAAACVGSGEGVPDPGVSEGQLPRTTEEIQRLIFSPLCADQCHRGGSAPKGLSLEPGVALRAMVGVASAEVPGLLRVAPGQPNESYLIVKVRPLDSRRVGARMPRTGPPFLTNGQIRALERWIEAGACERWQDVTPGGNSVVGDAGSVDGGARPQCAESEP